MAVDLVVAAVDEAAAVFPVEVADVPVVFPAVAESLVVAIHEGGHAVMAVAVGREDIHGLNRPDGRRPDHRHLNGGRRQPASAAAGRPRVPEVDRSQLEALGEPHADLAGVPRPGVSEVPK